MDAKERAQKRASEKARSAEQRAKSAGPRAERELPPGLTSYQDLIERYKTNVVVTPSGLTFLIQTINPGDYIAISGAPLLQYWADKGVDISDTDARNEAIAEMPDQDKADLILNDGFQDMVRNVVCAGVYSLKLVNKRQAECDPDKQELSIELIPMADMFELFTEIMKLSEGEEFAAELELFRETVEVGEGEALADKDT